MNVRQTCIFAVCVAVCSAVVVVVYFACSSYFPCKQDPRRISESLVPLHSSIALVDLKKVAIECIAGKEIEKQTDEANEELKKYPLELESAIKKLELSKTSETNPNKIEETNRKIEDMQLILYETVREKRQLISDAYKNAILELENRIKEAISAVSAEHGITVVIASDAIVYNTKECIDITETTIERINQLCKKIKLSIKQ